MSNGGEEGGEDEVDEEGDGAGAGGGSVSSTQPELWKYSRVGTESTAAPSVPQYATRRACGGAKAAMERRKARGVRA